LASNYYIIWLLYFYITLFFRHVEFAFNSLTSNQDPLTDICRGENGLNVNQKDECFRQPDAALAIAEGALDGLVQCSKQLAPRRWNCPYASRDLFKNGLERSELVVLRQCYFVPRATTVLSLNVEESITV